MASPYTWALIAVALVVAALSYQVPRAWLWLGLGALSFFVSTLFQDFAGRPDLQPFVTLGCDSLVCLAIYRAHREAWELPVYIAFMCSVFSSLIFIAFKFEHWVYASLLELCNLGALLWIGGTGLVDMLGRHENSAFHPWRVHLRHAHIVVRNHDKKTGS